jgi:TIR domain-containing protein
MTDARSVASQPRGATPSVLQLHLLQCCSRPCDQPSDKPSSGSNMGWLTECKAGEALLGGRTPMKVFISYRHADKRYKEQIVGHLKTHNAGRYEVWSDDGITPGDPWAQEIEKALASSGVVLVLCGHRMGDYQIREIRKALRVHKDGRVIPILLPGVRIPGEALAPKHALSFRDVFTPEGLGKLHKGMGLRHRPYNPLDSVHLHVDGIRSDEVRPALVRRIEKAGFEVALTPISDERRGPHIRHREFQGTYEVHAPQGDLSGHSFLTVWGPGHDGWREGLRQVLHALHGLASGSERLEGIVVEVERVIGWGPKDGPIEWLDTGDPLSDKGLTEDEVHFCGFRRQAIEVHLKLDIEHKTANSPVSLEALGKRLSQAGLPLGGMFSSQKEDRWCYRTNLFVPLMEYGLLKQTVERQYNIFRQVALGLTRRPEQIKTGVIVERCLGLWRTPLRTIDKRGDVPLRDRMTLSQIAEWEGRYEPMHEMWVIAPNFYGDVFPEVRQAMLDNFNRPRPVTYRYFLRSLTDARRLLRFADSLKAEAPVAPNKVIAYVLGANKILDAESFIAVKNPGRTSGVGYFISRNTSRSEFAARRMSPEEVRERLDKFRPLTEPDAVQGWAFTHDAIQSNPLGVQFILAIHTLHLDKRLNEDPRALEFYHDCIATGVSQHGGDITDARGDTSVATFQRQINEPESDVAERALAALLDIAELPEHLRHAFPRLPPLGRSLRFGLSYGPVTKVLRASGNVVYGQSIKDARFLAKSGVEDDVDATPSAVGQFPARRQEVFAPAPLDNGGLGRRRCHLDRLRQNGMASDTQVAAASAIATRKRSTRRKRAAVLLSDQTAV